MRLEIKSGNEAAELNLNLESTVNRQVQSGKAVAVFVFLLIHTSQHGPITAKELGQKPSVGDVWQAGSKTSLSPHVL